jgi:hypothetical protein
MEISITVHQFPLSVLKMIIIMFKGYLKGEINFVALQNLSRLKSDIEYNMIHNQILVFFSYPLTGKNICQRNILAGTSYLWKNYVLFSTLGLVNSDVQGAAGYNV